MPVADAVLDVIMADTDDDGLARLVPGDIADILGRRVNPVVVEEVLYNLESLGLLRREPLGLRLDMAGLGDPGRRQRPKWARGETLPAGPDRGKQMALLSLFSGTWMDRLAVEALRRRAGVDEPLSHAAFVEMDDFLAAAVEQEWRRRAAMDNAP